MKHPEDQDAAPRARIVAAALAVFAERGFAAGSVQQVADGAGMSKQALMHHFPSKLLIREGVYALLSSQLRTQFPAVAGELVSRSRDRYRATVEDVFARLCANPLVARFALFELLEEPDRFVAWLRAEAAPWVGLLREVASHWPAPDHAESSDVEALAVSMATSMLAHSALFPRTDAAPPPAVGAALELMLRGSRLID